jgi:hypothetical protein
MKINDRIFEEVTSRPKPGNPKIKNHKAKTGSIHK